MVKFPTVHEQLEKNYFISILKYCVFGWRFQIVNQVNDSKIKEKKNYKKKNPRRTMNRRCHTHVYTIYKHSDPFNHSTKSNQIFESN